MPIYEYRCEKGHTFEVLQRMSDDPVSKCEVCGAPVHRVFHPVAVHFKGSGFYNTDYGTRKRQRESGDGEKKASGGEGAKAGEGSKGGEGAKTEGSGGGEKKTESKAGSASD